MLTTLPAYLDHPECVAWSPVGKIYAGGEAGQVYRIDAGNGSTELFANTGGFVLGLALDAAANVYACDAGRQQLVKVTPAGIVSTYCAGKVDQKMRAPNYPVFDANGRLYVSDSGDWGKRNGWIWRIDPDGTADIWTDVANGFTNGLCLAPDRKWLYIAESTPPLISRVAILADGTAGEREVVIELPHTVPDGLAFDVQGSLYVACFTPNRIYRYTLTGDLSIVIEDWEQYALVTPTNIAFGGADMRTLYIASLGGWNIRSLPMDVAGLPLHYPKLD